MEESHRVFVHVSDIHFHHRWNGNDLDRDAELRRGVVREASAVVTSLGRCDGVLVTGDVAYSGDPAQYALAIEWLSELCQAVGCGPEEVWCVPGNHDVQRPESGGSREGLIQNLRTCEPNKVCDSLVTFLRDPSAEDIWFRCLKNYCDFARRFTCQVSAKGVWWTDPTMRLNDGSTLVIRGATSVLISNSHDHVERAKLVLGDVQLHHERRPEAVNLLLCHHPPDWLRDYEEVESALKAYAEVQLYGHKHTHAFREMDGRIRIHAGAVQPPRDESAWCPRFNVIELRVRRSEAHRFLDVTVHSRLWDVNSREFKIDAPPGGHGAYAGSTRLPDWDPPPAPTNNAPMPDPSSPGTPPRATPLQAGGARVGQNPHKLLTYRFFDLAYTVRLKIAQELGLIDEADEQLTERERMRQVFERARARRKLEALWQTVRQRTGASDMPGEPFAGQ